MRNRIPVIPVFVAVCVIVLVIIVVVVRSCASQPSSQSAVGEVAAATNIATHATHGENAQGHGSYTLEPSDMLDIPNTTRVTSFSLGSAAAPELSDAQLEEVNALVEQIESSAYSGYSGTNVYNGFSEDDGGNNCTCGFVFLDLATGHGLAYKAGEVVYIASAAKGPVAYYALTHGGGTDEDERYDIQNTIENSDNDSFEAFAYAYTTADYAEWLAKHEVFHDEYYYDLYPMMSARSLMMFWAEILQFIEGGSANATWFAGLLGSTETSFIRDGLPGDVTVMNKGGWNLDVGFESVSDAGIIKEGDRTYLMAIVTNQPDGGAAEANVTDLAAALFALRSSL